MKRIAIIGAGVGGLATAVRLAKKGNQVTIFEKSGVVGGKCQQIKFDGFTFDAGPTLLTIPAVYRDLFLKTGKRLEHVMNLKPVDPAFTYHFADGKVLELSNVSLKKNCDEIEAAFGKDAADQWHNLMQRAEYMWDISRVPFVESELKIKNILKNTSLKNLFAISPHRSLRSYVKRFTKDKHLQMIIDRYATYSGSDPRKAPAPLLTIPFIESALGAWHIEGGVGMLSEKLAERAKELGVEINLNTEITAINFTGNTATGLTLGGDLVQNFDVIVANADPKLVYNKLISPKNKKARKERKKTNSRGASFSGFSIFLALDNSKVSGTLPKLSHHNIWFPADYDEEFASIFEKNKPVEDPAIYIAAPKDASLIPAANFEAWGVLVNAPLHDPGNGIDWRVIEKEYANQIIKKLDQLGLRVSERLVRMEIRSPATLQDSVSAPGGAIYGASSNGMRGAFLRSKNKSDLENLYFVGGGAHPGGGLPLVGISSEIVANLIS
jgi:phytoene desaturase